jgi:hypothetical protein
VYGFAILRKSLLTQGNFEPPIWLSARIAGLETKAVMPEQKLNLLSAAP